MNGKSLNSMKRELAESRSDGVMGYTEKLELLEKVYNLITEDPGYKAIYDRAVKESTKANPVRRGLFGTEKLITKQGKYGGSGEKRRQVINANFQLTASEIVATSLHAMYLDLLTRNNKYNLSIEQLTPTATIYDEVIFDVDNEVLEEAKELIQFYVLPQVEGWARFEGKLTVGTHYVPK